LCGRTADGRQGIRPCRFVKRETVAGPVVRFTLFFTCGFAVELLRWTGSPRRRPVCACWPAGFRFLTRLGVSRQYQTRRAGLPRLEKCSDQLNLFSPPEILSVSPSSRRGLLPGDGPRCGGPRCGRPFDVFALGPVASASANQKQVDPDPTNGGLSGPCRQGEQVLLLPSELTLSLSLLLAGTQEPILTEKAGDRVPKVVALGRAAATDFVSQ
jgi:hypothetical protein